MLRRLKRSLGWWALLEGNRLLGRSWAPSPRREIFIEPTSACNLGCRFCAYETSPRPRRAMTEELFRSVAEQAAGMGFSRVWLTPQTGDVFMDKGLEAKLAILEGLDGIAETAFYTNLAAATPARLEGLARFTKIAEIQISLYGADEAQFTAFTRRPAGAFRALLDNLDHLAVLAEHHRPARLGLALRVGDGFRLEEWRGPLAERALRLRDRFGVGLSVDTEYDDWGGAIRPEDIAGLGITLLPGRAQYHAGACIRALGQVMVKADGSVDACACRDSRHELALGHAAERPLAEILSWANPRYRTLLEGMQAGRFPDTCRRCSLYRSVFDPRWTAGRDDVMPLPRALELLGK